MVNKGTAVRLWGVEEALEEPAGAEGIVSGGWSTEWEPNWKGLVSLTKSWSDHLRVRNGKPVRVCPMSNS